MAMKMGLCTKLSAVLSVLLCAATANAQTPDPGDPDCESMKDELVDFAMWASDEINEARNYYDNDPSADLAVRYFGEYVDTDQVSRKLALAADRGASGNIEFICHNPNIDKCQEYPTMAFYFKSGEYMRPNGWTVHVCGTRFWDPQYKNGRDTGIDASQVGIMVHELAHLAGAFEDLYLLNEDRLVAAVKEMRASLIADSYAESFRQYVMHIH